jgi:hypothetical protein
VRHSSDALCASTPWLFFVTVPRTSAHARFLRTPRAAGDAWRV